MLTTIYTDVVIIGAGSAGVAATIAASEKQQQVILIEKNNYLGGLATGAEVGTICGLYAFSKNPVSQYVVSGFVKEFAEELKNRSQTAPLHNSIGMHYLPYNISAYKQLCQALVSKPNIITMYNHSVVDVEQTNNQINSVTVNDGINKIIIVCKTVVDCSGNAIVSQLLNIPVIKSNTYQAAAQVFTMQGIDNTNEALLGMMLIKEIKKGIDAGVLASYYDRISIVQGSVINKQVSFKIGIPVEVTHTDANKLEVKNKAVELVKTIAIFLIENVASFKNASLLSYAPEVGYRVDCRGLGKYILVEGDVLQCKKFETSIANGAWPIEIWGQDKRVQMRYFAEDNFYQIPKECLVSDKISNLFFAGRNISADDIAIASARVMGICLQTGYAAGNLGSIQISGDKLDPV